MKKIGILCSGGDAPGINNVINKLFFELHQQGIELCGFFDGFKGIYDKKFKIIQQADIDGLQFSPGSIIGCERFPELTQKAVFSQIIANLKTIQISELIIFGGDGSLQGAKLFQAAKIKVHFIPTTIDNDVKEVKSTLGFQTALDSIIKTISQINSSAFNHQKINIIEVMGRTCPDLANWASLACNADFTINLHNYRDVDLYEKMNEKIGRSLKRSPIIIVSEKLLDLQEIVQNLNSKKGKWVNVLGHLQRGGMPVYADLILGNQIAQKIALNICKGKTDFIYQGD